MANALARRRAWRVATHPAVALPVWLVNYFAWHAPPIYDAALQHQSWLIHVEHACYFGTGVLVWWPLVQDSRRRLASGARAAYAFAAFVLASPLGLLLALLPRPVYSFYVDARPRRVGAQPARRPADRRRHDGERAGARALRRLRVLVPPLPRRGRSYLRQPVIRLRSSSDGCVVPQEHGVPVLAKHVVDADVLGVEPAVGLVDVVGIRDRRAEDDRHEVRGELRVHRSAGRGRRDEIERAAELDVLRAQTGPRLRQRRDRCGTGAAACGDEQEERRCDQDDPLHGASV